MKVTNLQDLAALKAAGRAVSETLTEMLMAVKPGVSTLELDQLGERALIERGARSAPRTMYDFPGATCISVNNEVAHGIPKGDRVLQAGDLINIDVSAIKEGVYGDTGATIVVPGKIPSTEQIKLMRTTFMALQEALRGVRAGALVNSIGQAIERVGKKNGYAMIRSGIL